MKREIKFRAWHTEAGKFFEPTYEGSKGKIEELNIQLNGRLGLRIFDNYLDESVFEDRFIIQQFTGLSDKNGKEIFEGDIVLDQKNDLMGVVYFYAPQFIVQTQENIPFQLAKGMVNVKNLLDTEVIGNIYENPNLLNP